MSYQKYNNNKEYKPRSRRKLKKLPPINQNLLIVVLMLIIFGTVAIFSATAPDGLYNFENPLYYPIRHIAFGIVGIFGMIITSRIHYQNWAKEKWVMYITWVVIGLILATLIPGIGRTDYGSSRWIGFGPLQIQPSEFCKFTCILLMATALSKAKSLKSEICMKHAFLILIMLGIIVKQPNLSMCIILGSTCLAMLWAAGLNRIIFIGTAALAAFGGVFSIFKNSYQSSRIIGWLHPELDPQGAGYNILQSWYAISSGGFFGAGLGASKQKLYYLPVGYTDFIFSVIAEEMGFVGITVLICLFVLFMTFGFKVATHCNNAFGRLLAFGIVFNISFQALTNMCVASGVFPVTGVTLPLISYGGSSFIATCAMLGILFNISRYSVKAERKLENGQLKQQPQT